jgi:thiol:disulfide interchange protein DsbD
VDFTADWCLTCQANKKFALEVPAVIQRLQEIKAVTLLGDYTRLPKNITQELQRFGRAGVPLVLVYPADRAKDPQVLPEALTPSIVLEALNQAVQ